MEPIQGLSEPLESQNPQETIVELQDTMVVSRLFPQKPVGRGCCQVSSSGSGSPCCYSMGLSTFLVEGRAHWPVLCRGARKPSEQDKPIQASPCCCLPEVRKKLFFGVGVECPSEMPRNQ